MENVAEPLQDVEGEGEVCKLVWFPSTAYQLSKSLGRGARLPSPLKQSCYNHNLVIMDKIFWQEQED